MVNVYNIKDYGAIGDGKFNNASTIQKAIDLGNEFGGGEVVIPAGRGLRDYPGQQNLNPGFNQGRLRCQDK
jgi:polygalacturonase